MPSTPTNETNTNSNGNGLSLRGPIPLQAVIALLTFVAGVLVSLGMGWGHSSSSLDNIALSVSRLEGEIQTLGEKYTNSDKTVTQQLQKMDDHLTYDDMRIDKLEQRSVK
jgi:hypothetical protein